MTVDSSSSVGNSLRRISVKINNLGETKDILTTDIYSFKAAREMTDNNNNNKNNNNNNNNNSNNNNNTPIGSLLAAASGVTG